MKNYKKISGGLRIFAFIAILASCAKETYVNPPAKVYTVDFDTNMTIAKFKELYQGNKIIVDSDIVISGTVISDDKPGNFYKKLVIQDSTAGIELEIDNTAIFVTYPLGTKVYVKCKGLILDNYRGVLQLTYNSNNSSQKIPALALPTILYRVDGGIPIVPKTKKLSQLSYADINTLVKIDSVEFIASDTSKNYADPTATANRTIQDFVQLQNVVVRNSNFATFANAHLPKGNGSITAIYSVYEGGTPPQQLFIRDTTDVKMTGPRISRTYALNETFDTNFGTFTTYNVSGSATWYWASHSTDYYITINGYSSHAANEDWLISPKMDMSAYKNAFLSFIYAANYVTNWNDLTVWVSTDYSGTGNPNLATWHQLSGYPQVGGSSFPMTNSGPLDLSSYLGKPNVHIAFKYVCTASEAAAWEINSATVVVQ